MKRHIEVLKSFILVLILLICEICIHIEKMILRDLKKQKEGYGS